jgi:hypothetical protein
MKRENIEYFLLLLVNLFLIQKYSLFKIIIILL